MTKLPPPIVEWVGPQIELIHAMIDLLEKSQGRGCEQAVDAFVESLCYPPRLVVGSSK